MAKAGQIHSSSDSKKAPKNLCQFPFGLPGNALYWEALLLRTVQPQFELGGDGTGSCPRISYPQERATPHRKKNITPNPRTKCIFLTFTLPSCKRLDVNGFGEF
jgi:hypothetical protein